MADEIVSQLALDASKVLTAFAELQAAMNQQSQTIQNLAQGIKTFNSAEAGMAPAIDSANKALSAQAQIAKDTANQLRAVFTGRIDSTATVTEIKKVNDAFAALERTLTSTKASPTQVQNILGNLKGAFTGQDAQIQSALIAAKTAADNLGSSNAASTLKINQAAIKGKADALAQAEAQALSKASESSSIASAAQLSSRFNTSGADSGALNRFQASVQNFQQVAQKSGLSGSQLSGVINNLGQTFSGAQGRVAQAALQVQKFGGALQGVQTTASGFGANLQSLVKVFTFQQALQGLGALQNAFSSSIGNAITFERAIAQVSTISGEGDKNIDTLAVKVNLLANEFGKNNVETATGLYHAFSNQVGDSAQTVQFFSEALKFSKAAVTDVSSSVDALSAVQNAYGQSSSSASHNADVLFRTIDLGRVSAKELGDSFGRILPIAAQLGVSLEEVSAAISTATVQGVKFQDAQTQILNLLVAALKPTGDLKKQMDSLGFASTNAGIAAEGFIGFFSKIAEGSKTSEELAKLFPNIRGLRGELSLFGDSGKRLTDFLQQTTDSAGAAQKAFDTIQFSNAEKVSNELNRIQNQITQGFGRDVVAVLATVNDAFGGVADKVVFLGEALALAFGSAVFLGAANQLLSILVSVGGAFGVATTAATGFGVGLLAVGAIAVAAYKLLQPPDFASKFDENVAKMQISAAKLATDTANQVRDANKGVQDSLNTQVQSLLQVSQQKQAALNNAFSQAASIEAATTSNFKTEVNQRLRAYTQFLSAIEDLQNKAATHAVEVATKQAQFTQSIQDTRFQNKFDNATASQQTTLLNQQINKLLTKSSVSQAAGNTTFAEQEIEKAKELALQFEKITGNRTLTSKVEQAYTAFLAAQTDQLNKQVAVAKELQSTNTANVEEARTQLELALNLDGQLQKIGKEKGFNSPEALAVITQIQAALTKADAAQGKLNAGLGNVGKNASSSQIQTAIDALKKVTNGPPLNVTFTTGLDKFRAEVQKQLDAQPFAASLKLTIDSANTQALQNEIAKLAKTANAGLEKQTAVPGAIDAFDTSIKAINEGITQFKNQLNDAAGKAKLSELINPLPIFGGTFGGNVNNLKAIDEEQKKAVANLDATQAKIKDVFTDPTSFNEFGRLTADAFKKIEVQLQPFKNLIEKAAAPDASATDKAFGQISQRIVDATKQASILKQTFSDISAGIEAGGEAQKKLNDLSTPDKQTKIQTPNDVIDKITPDKNALQSKEQLRDIEKELQNAIDTTGKDAQASADSQIQSTQNVTSSVEVLNGAIVSTEFPVAQLTERFGLLGQDALVASEDTVSGLNLIGITAIEQIGGVAALTEALFRMAEASAAASGGGGGGGGEFASRGAFIQHFAQGGLARGRDTIPAMLSPGEVVVAPGPSRKFFSQLMAMNAGVQPSFRSNGGTVGDTFGDINVNIHSNGPSDINARAIAQGIQRELRRGSIRR